MMNRRRFRRVSTKVLRGQHYLHYQSSRHSLHIHLLLSLYLFLDFRQYQTFHFRRFLHLNRGHCHHRHQTFGYLVIPDMELPNIHDSPLRGLDNLISLLNNRNLLQLAKLRIHHLFLNVLEPHHRR